MKKKKTEKKKKDKKKMKKMTDKIYMMTIYMKKWK